MDLSAFYKECQALPENERRWVDVFYKTTLDLFGEKDAQGFEDHDKVCRLFCGNSVSISKAQYYRKRKLVYKLYEWLVGQGAVSDDFLQEVYKLQLQDVVSDLELHRYYFRDLDEVLRYVQLVGSMKGLGEEDDLLNVKTIVILSWYLLSLKEIQGLHKTDLRPDGSILVGSKHLKIEKRHYDVLQRFAEIDVHKGFPSHKKQVYTTSPYLLRSARQISLSENNIQQVIMRFNSVGAGFGKELSVLCLRKNGIFNKAYNSDGAKSIGTAIQEITGCDTAFAFGYKEFYTRWKFIIMGDATEKNREEVL